MSYSRTSVTERILRATDRTGSCWLWLRTLDKDGYGYIRDSNQVRRGVHIVAYEEWVGPIAQGLQVDHLCRVRNCVNPTHLEAVTPVENIRRSRVSEAAKARSAAITHCPQNHEYTQENTIIQKSGSRKCRECGRLYNQIKRRDAK